MLVRRMDEKKWRKKLSFHKFQIHCCILHFVSWLLDTSFFIWSFHSLQNYSCFLHHSLSSRLFFISGFMLLGIMQPSHDNMNFLWMGIKRGEQNAALERVGERETRDRTFVEENKIVVMNKRWHNNCCVQSINYPCDVDCCKPIIVFI